MKTKENALTSPEDLPPPKHVKISEDERINRELHGIFKEQADSIRSAEEEVFRLRNALIELRRLIAEEKISGKEKISWAIEVMEGELKKLLAINEETKDINLNNF